MNKSQHLTNCKLHCGVRGVSFAGFPFRSSVSFGQELRNENPPRQHTLTFYNASGPQFSLQE